jgi:hypothetical protein
MNSPLQPKAVGGGWAAWLLVAVWTVVAPARWSYGVDALPRASGSFRVESELFEGGGAEPVARSLTLFRDGVAWDFLELPADASGRADGGPMELSEIVLHDPARERIVVVDPARHVRTQIESVRLQRLSVSLARWAGGADDRLVRWAGGPSFDADIKQLPGPAAERKPADRKAAKDVHAASGPPVGLELAGPRVRYAVRYQPAPSAAAAASYRDFADTALLLRALLHPGGIPPFPRLALNHHIAQAGGIPTEVTLDIEPRLGRLAGAGESLRSRHRALPKLLPSDLQRIADAEARLAASDQVELTDFVARDTAQSAN